MATYKSKAMQAIQAKRGESNSAAAVEIAKLRIEVDRLTRKVQELMGERGDNPAVRVKTFSSMFSNAVGGIFGGGV